MLAVFFPIPVPCAYVPTQETWSSLHVSHPVIGFSCRFPLIFVPLIPVPPVPMADNGAVSSQQVPQCINRSHFRISQGKIVLEILVSSLRFFLAFSTPGWLLLFSFPSHEALVKTLREAFLEWGILAFVLTVFQTVTLNPFQEHRGVHSLRDLRIAQAAAQGRPREQRPLPVCSIFTFLPHTGPWFTHLKLYGMLKLYVFLLISPPFPPLFTLVYRRCCSPLFESRSLSPGIFFGLSKWKSGTNSDFFWVWSFLRRVIFVCFADQLDF